MAIVKMNKFTLLAFENKKAEILERLQGFAEVEFVNLQESSFLEENIEFQELSKDKDYNAYAGCEEKLSMTKFALEFLKEFIPQKSALKAMKEGKRSLSLKELEDEVSKGNYMEVYTRVKKTEEEIATLENKRAKLLTLVDSMKPWENFDATFEDLTSLKSPYFIGSVPKAYEEALKEEMENCYLEIISVDNQDIFFFVLANEENKDEIFEKLRTFGFSQLKTEVKDTPLKTIHDSMDLASKLESKKFFIEEELSNLEESYHTLEVAYEYYANLVDRSKAINNLLRTENISVVQGWLAEEDKSKLSDIIKDTLGEEYYLQYDEVRDDEISDVPVKLKNNDLNSSFENITEMYATPRYDEVDPTPFVTPFYLLFFGMMVADIGYGLLQLIVSLVALKYFNLDEGNKKFAKFFYYLSFPIIGFGIIYGSFFGGIVEMPWRLVDPNKDVTTILVVSVIFGAVQIFFGLGIKAYMLIKAGKKKDAFYDVGAWVITLVSIALVLGAGMLGLPPFVKYLAIFFMIFGMVVIVLTGGRTEKTPGARIGQGAYALYGITGYVGDLVSYTRLMALGLAGGSLAGAFNMIMGMVPGIAGILFAPVIFIFGHIFNLALGLLGAYVHTCRLQYVEYFGKFYEGGGKPFTPFKTGNKFINVKKD